MGDSIDDRTSDAPSIREGNDVEGFDRVVLCPNSIPASKTACKAVIHRHGDELGDRAPHCGIDSAEGYCLVDATPKQVQLMRQLIKLDRRRRAFWRRAPKMDRIGAQVWRVFAVGE